MDLSWGMTMGSSGGISGATRNNNMLIQLFRSLVDFVIVIGRR